jgi:hypothetical protein
MEKERKQGGVHRTFTNNHVDGHGAEQSTPLFLLSGTCGKTPSDHAAIAAVFSLSEKKVERMHALRESYRIEAVVSGRPSRT